MGLIRSGIQMGGAYAIANKGMKTYERTHGSQQQQQQLQPQQSNYQPARVNSPSYQQTSRDARDKATDHVSWCNGKCQGQCNVYEHFSWCNGQCGKQCNGQQSGYAEPVQGQRMITADTSLNTPPTYEQSGSGNGMQDMLGHMMGGMGGGMGGMSGMLKKM